MPGFKQYDELPAYYALASAFVLASVVEPWGLVVNEAMASGLPVLVSERCGCAASLVRAGENGYMFDPADTGAIGASMARMAHASDASRQEMGRASATIIEEFGPARFATGLLRAAGHSCADRATVPPLGSSVLLETLLLGRG
jgi:glycosyltransferase involved in cell wall biosynthesis